MFRWEDDSDGELERDANKDGNPLDPRREGGFDVSDCSGETTLAALHERDSDGTRAGFCGGVGLLGFGGRSGLLDKLCERSVPSVLGLDAVPSAYRGVEEAPASISIGGPPSDDDGGGGDDEAALSLWI